MAQKTLNTIIVLRNGSKEAWEADNSYRLQAGEVGVGYMTVAKTIDGETKNVQVPIIKVGDGSDTAWKDLPQAEGVFEEDQILTYNFGRHTTSNGFVNAGGKGMTTSEWLLDALSETKDPAVGQPSFSMMVKTHNGKSNGTVLGYGIVTNTGTAEIGSKIKTISWDGTFSAGSYEFGSKIGDTKYTDTATGVTASYDVSCTKEGTFTDGVDGTVTLNPQISISSTSSAEVAKITNVCTWGDSPRTPVNNVGAIVDSKRIKGSPSSKEITFSITGFREGFFFGTTSDVTATADLDSATIRGLAKTGAKYAAGTKNMTVPVGASTIILACPAGSTGVTKVYNNTVNADMTTSFTKTEGISVGGADATATSIGDYAENYNVWTFTPAEAYGTETSLTVTLG